MNTTAEQFEIVKAGVRKSAPLVADFFETDTPLGEYTRHLHEFAAHPVHQERQVLLKKTIRAVLRKSFTEEEIAAANINWDEDQKVNIVDHHNFLNHPLLVTANIIANLWQLPSSNPRGIVVLSDSGVPMNNFFHKRGMKYKDKQLNMVPSRERHMIYYAAPVHKTLPIAKAAAEQGMSEQDIDFAHSIQTILEASAEHSLVKNFRGQVSRVNRELWKMLFHEDVRQNIPDLLYITNEDVCHEMLKTLFEDKANIFTRILFDAPTREIFLKEFSGVVGCWNGRNNAGTTFFWGLNEMGENITLEVEGNYLVAHDKSQDVRIPLTKEAILGALEKEVIYPSMFLVYGVCVFYCGIRPLVGFGSMNYQTKMKEAWLRAMKQIAPSEMPLLESINTRGFVGGPTATLGFNREKGFVSLYAMDLISKGGMTKRYLEQLAKMPFNAILKPALLDIYDSYLLPDEKQPLTITANDLMQDGFQWLKEL